jgi:hypothetical protein
MHITQYNTSLISCHVANSVKLLYTRKQNKQRSSHVMLHLYGISLPSWLHTMIILCLRQ